jgi:uncharacterized protein (DUF433 family)
LGSDDAGGKSMSIVSNQLASITRTERGLVVAGTRITVYDIMDCLKAQYPSKFICDAFNLTSEQVDAAIAYIESHQAAVEAEYQAILLAADEVRHYWEAHNRERFAQIAAAPPRPGHEAVRAKLRERKAQREVQH